MSLRNGVKLSREIGFYGMRSARNHGNLVGMATREPSVLISQDQFAPLKQRALQAERLRVNHNFHPSMEDNLHRFLNVMAKGTYVPPHRHASTPKPESFLVLEGEVALILFGDSGVIEQIHILGASTEPRQWGVDLLAGVWHSLVVLSETVVIFEVKPGPYVAVSDKDFAPWAPREGEPGAQAYLGELLAAVERQRPPL